MKYKFICVFLVVSVKANRENRPGIIENNSEQDKNGYNFRFSTSDGQTRQEIGKLDKVEDNLILRVKGSYSYHSSDGKLIEVSYEADEGGYKPLPHFSLDSRSRTVVEKNRERESVLVKNETQTEPVTEEGAAIRETTSYSILNTTVTTEKFKPTPISSIPLPGISGAAIASLAGGGLG